MLPFYTEGDRKGRRKKEIARDFTNSVAKGRLTDYSLPVEMKHPAFGRIERKTNTPGTGVTSALRGCCDSLC